MDECPGIGENVLEVINVSKSYGKKLVLKELTFEVKYGSIWALLGPNGSGKTTTLRIVAGLLGWDNGIVKLFGMKLEPRGFPNDVRKLISYLPEEAGVYERLTGWENLFFYALIYSKDRREAEEMADFGVRLSGLGNDIFRKAGEYSKGMKRRLLLARTLMVRPCLAILDEPTSGLDVFSSLDIRRTISDFVRRTSATVILSSHNMLEVQHISDEVAFLYKGSIIEKGKPEELLKRYSAKTLEEVYVTVVRPSAG